MASGGQVFGIVLVLGGIACIITGVATNYWSTSQFTHQGLVNICIGGHGSLSKILSKFLPAAIGELGLKAQNNEFFCYNRYQGTGFKVGEEGRNHEEDFFTHGPGGAIPAIVLLLMLVSAVLALSALICAPCCINAKRCGCCLAYVTVLSFLAGGGGVALYAIYALSMEHPETLSIPGFSLSEWSPSWSYYVSVGGVVVIFIGGVMMTALRRLDPIPVPQIIQVTTPGFGYVQQVNEEPTHVERAITNTPT